MANWKRLKALQRQSKILTFVIICLIAFLLLTPRHYLKTDSVITDNIEHLRVTAKRGANIRDTPSTAGSTLEVAPRNARLRVIEKAVQDDVVNNRSGSWHKVQYKRRIGYVWGNLLDIDKTFTP